MGRLIKLLFEFWADAPDTFHHLPSPLYVFNPPLDRPIDRWACSNCTQVARLVGEFKHLGPRALACCTFDLFALSVCFWQAFVVGDLGNDRRNIVAKCSRNHFSRDLRILDGIMQQGGNYQISVGSTGCLGHEHCDFEQMVDVGLLSRTLTAVVYVPACGGISRL